MRERKPGLLAKNFSIRSAHYLRILPQRANDPTSKSDHRNGLERNDQASCDGGPGSFVDLRAHDCVRSRGRPPGRPESRRPAHRSALIRSAPHRPRPAARERCSVGVHRKKRQRLPAKARVSLDARANILARCGALRETMLTVSPVGMTIRKAA